MPVKFDSDDLASMRCRRDKFPRVLSPDEQALVIETQVVAAGRTPEGARAFRRVAMLTGK